MRKERPSGSRLSRRCVARIRTDGDLVKVLATDHPYTVKRLITQTGTDTRQYARGTALMFTRDNSSYRE